MLSATQSSPGNSYYLQKNGVDSVSFNKQSAPPLAYVDKGILYELNDGKLYYNGNAIATGDSIAAPNPTVVNSLARWDDVTGTALNKTTAVVTEPRAGAINITSGDYMHFKVSLDDDNLPDPGPQHVIASTSTQVNPYSVALGIGTLDSNTTGEQDVAIGPFAMYAYTGGFANVGIGFEALSVPVTNNSVGVGYKALVAHAGDNNVGIGNNAGSGGAFAALTGDSNVYIGDNAGAQVSGTCNNNVLISHNSALANTSGNIILGTAGTHTTARIAGIYDNVTYTGGRQMVLVDSVGKLHTVPAGELLLPIKFAASTADDYSIDGTDGWTDIPASITARGSGANNPAFTTFRNGISAYEFSGTGSTMHEVWSEIHIPHQYSPGTGIYFHVHCATAAATPSGNVKINFEYTYAKSGENFPATAVVSKVFTLDTQYKHYIVETDAPILAADLEVDGVVLLRVYRDAADVQDTSTNPIHIFFVDCHINTSKVSTKFRNKATGSFYV